MNYKDFLLLMSQMRHYGCAKLFTDEVEIFITSVDEMTWELKILLTRLEKDVPFSTFLQWQPRGSFLRADPDGSLFLIQEVTPNNKYIFLKELFRDFLNIALEWHEIFEYTPISSVR